MGISTGTRLGPYEVGELLGAGGMGEVYRAHDPRLGRDVALKVLPERYAHSDDRVRRFEREARMAGALNHPNILTVFDVGTQDGRPYLVSELLEGRTLLALLQRERLDVRQVLRVTLELGRGLACAHDAGIVHRDLKPSNLFLTRDGRVKILDFGLAKLLQPETGMDRQALTNTHSSHAGRAVGTAAYMSPEQIRGGTVDARSDIFAVGTIVYEMLAGRAAFVGMSDSDVMASILRDEPPPLEALAPGVPMSVEAMVRRCLEKRREDRFGSARELFAAVQALLDSSPAAPAYAGGSDPVVGELRKIAPARLPRVALPLAATVCVLIGVALPFQRRAKPPSAAPVAVSVAVMNFENLSDPRDADNLGRMLATLVTTELGGAGAVHVVSSQRLSDVARQLGHVDGPDRAIATEVARRAGAGTMVLGHVMRAGPRMVATAELVAVDGGERLGSYRAEGTIAQDVFAMSAGLASQLRARVTGRSSQRGPEPLTGQLTGSVEAYRAYVRGETLLHRLEWPKAVEAFREATRLDPDFALAHYRLAIARYVFAWGDLGADGRAAAERAIALKAKLPARERAVLEGAALIWAGRRSDAVPILEAGLTQDSENKELLYLLSECYMQAPREIDPRRAAELMERILVLDADFRLVYLQLATAYAVLGDFDTAHARLDEWEAKEPESVRGIRSMVRLLEGRLDEAVRLTESPRTPEVALWRCYFAMHAGRFDITREIIAEQERLPAPTVPHFRDTPSCGGVVESFAVYHGQFARVERPLREWASTFPFAAYESTPAGVQGLLNLADMLALKGDVQGAREAAEKTLLVGPDTPYCLYAAGVFAIAASDLPAAEERLRRLEQVAARSHGALVPHYRDALVAEIALAHGRPAEARLLLERAVGSGKLQYEVWTGFVPAVRLRDSLARTYLALGDKESAAQVLADLVEDPQAALTPLNKVRALYRVGALRMDLGDRVRGRVYLEKFLDHWGKADWDLPEVRDARARLAASS